MAAAAATAEPRHIGQTLSGKLGWPWALVPLRESGLPSRQTARASRWRCFGPCSALGRGTGADQLRPLAFSSTEPIEKRALAIHREADQSNWSSRRVWGSLFGLPLRERCDFEQLGKYHETRRLIAATTAPATRSNCRLQRPSSLPNPGYERTPRRARPQTRRHASRSCAGIGDDGPV